MIYKGGASHISTVVLHRPFYRHKLTTRSDQHRVHHRVQRTDLPGRRFLLYIFCPGSDGLSAQKTHHSCNRNDPRSFPTWSRERPSHCIILGLQCHWHILFILALGLGCKCSHHELVDSRLRWRDPLQFVLLGVLWAQGLHWTDLGDWIPLKVDCIYRIIRSSDTILRLLRD